MICLDFTLDSGLDLGPPQVESSGHWQPREIGRRTLGSLPSVSESARRGACVGVCPLAQNILFLLNERDTQKAMGKPVIRFGDIYHSANRTPSSTASESWLKAETEVWATTLAKEVDNPPFNEAD